jgi:hypothetical protein
MQLETFLRQDLGGERPRIDGDHESLPEPPEGPDHDQGCAAFGRSALGERNPILLDSRSGWRSGRREDREERVRNTAQQSTL